MSYQHYPRPLFNRGKKINGFFNADIAIRIYTYLKYINNLYSPHHRRFLKVILGGILVDFSNVFVNGKGRKYRQNWKTRDISCLDFDIRFESAIMDAFNDLKAFQDIKHQQYNLIRGDSRKKT